MPEESSAASKCPRIPIRRSARHRPCRNGMPDSAHDTPDNRTQPETTTLSRLIYPLRYVRVMGRRAWRNFLRDSELRAAVVFHALFWLSKIALLYLQLGTLNAFLETVPAECRSADCPENDSSGEFSPNFQLHAEILANAGWFVVMIPFIFRNSTSIILAYLLIASLSRAIATLEWFSRMPYMRNERLLRLAVLRRNLLLAVMLYFLGTRFRKQDLADVALEQLQWSEAFLRSAEREFPDAWSPQWQHMLVQVCRQIANTHDQLGDTVQAGNYFETAWKESSPSELTCGWPTGGHGLSDTDHLVHCDDILAVIDAVRKSGNLTTSQREFAARMYVTRAETNYKLRRVDEAFADLRRAIEEFHHVAARECHPLADAYLARARIHLDLSDMHGAISDFENITTLYRTYDVKCRSRSELEVDYANLVNRLRIYTEISSLFSKFEEFNPWVRDWAIRTSRQICSRCTDVLVATTRSPNDSRITRMRTLYKAFHHNWLNYSMVHDVDTIPQIVMAIQGREIGQQVADEYSNNWTARTTGTARRIHRIDGATGLWDLFRVRNYYAGNGGWGADESSYSDTYQSVTRANLQKLLTEDDEMLVLLLESVVEGANVYGAYCLAKTGTSTLFMLGDLSGVIDAMVNFGREYAVKGNIGNEVHGYQCVHLSSFWENMHKAVESELWSHLRHITCWAKRLVVVTQGNLHMLPVEAGKPGGVSVTIYPGLIYFLDNRRYEGDSSWGRFSHTVDLATSYYSGSGGTFPLARSECEMVCDLLTRDHNSVRIETQVNFDGFYGDCEFLLICCHNGADREMPNSYSLKIGRRKSLDSKSIRDTGLRARAVIASTCLGGVIKEDRDGNPMGLFTGFWLRGTQVLVASRVAVPDDWMPVLSLLMFQALSRDVTTLEAALEVAKRRLCSGDWYEDTEDLLRTHVLDVWRENLYSYYIKVLDKGAQKNRKLCARFVEEICVYAGMSDVERREIFVRYVSQNEKSERRRIIEGLSERFAEERIRRRVPPQPVRGILMYAVSAFGASEHLLRSRK